MTPPYHRFLPTTWQLSLSLLLAFPSLPVPWVHWYSWRLYSKFSFFSTQLSIILSTPKHNSNNYLHMPSMDSVSSTLIYPIVYWISSLDGLASTSYPMSKIRHMIFPQSILTPWSSLTGNWHHHPPTCSSQNLKVILEFSSPSLSTSKSCWIDLQNILSKPSTSPLLYPTQGKPPPSFTRTNVTAL